MPIIRISNLDGIEMSLSRKFSAPRPLEQWGHAVDKFRKPVDVKMAIEAKGEINIPAQF